MRFSTPPRRHPPESIVPMINVVFLLLIFFLMTAQIAPPDPIEVQPPMVTQPAGMAEGEFTLYLGADGTLAFRDATGEEAAIAALKAAKEEYCALGGCSDTVPPPPVILRAGAELPGATLARLMPRLAQAGFAEIQLVTVAQ